MAKKQKIVQTAKSKTLKIVYPHTAGIDVGKDLMQVSIPDNRCEESNRSFGTFTENLREIVKWLKENRIQRAVMESTGVYWIPLFLMLEESGIEALLVNARDVKNMSGRKTDVSDADWLRMLGSMDLITPCFQTASGARRLRAYARQRRSKVTDMATTIQHMQKAMEQMNIKLSSVLSDITGKSGWAIIKAILNGERNPAALAALADGRCHNSKETIAKALEGTWDAEHLLSLRQAVETYEFLQKQVAQCDTEIQMFLDSYEMNSPSVSKYGVKNELKRVEKSGKSQDVKNGYDVDLEQYAFNIYGINLMSIPGIGCGTLMVIMSELGPDFTTKFKTAGKFCRWCNLSPKDEITGGRVVSSKVPKRPNPVGQAFRQSAVTIRRKKGPLGDFYRRMAGRLGPAQAVVATAHKIAELVYLLVSRQQDYNPDTAKKDLAGANEKRIKYYEKRLTELKKAQHRNNENQIET